MKRLLCVFTFLHLCTFAFSQERALRDCFPFLVGAAVNVEQQRGHEPKATDILFRHFNNIVAENCMKCEVIHPTEHEYFWDDADEFVNFGERHNMQVIGHCLIWHSQCAPWFCVDEKGELVKPEVLKKRMREHIHTVVGRYKGRVRGWDVVNEMVEDDGSFRKSQFYQILGEDYIALALKYAHEADPKAELYLNDFSMNNPKKRATYVRLITKLRKQGLRLDAMGMQSHYGMDYPRWTDFEATIKALIGTGVKVMFTEIDMNVLPTTTQGANVSDRAAYRASMDPYRNGMPDSVSQVWNDRMRTFFRIIMKYAPHVLRVNAWGIADGGSWLNGWPIPGRTNYPLWFDRQYQPKPFIKELIAPRKAVFSDFRQCVGTQHGASATTLKSLHPYILTSLPVGGGCYPDPSICRVGEDYYLVNSSFAYFPAVPIWHSSDRCKTWQRLGFVLNRPSQFYTKDGLAIRNGIYAPAISYNPKNKLFYMVTTAVDGGGNFFVTTKDPKSGHWSEPTFLPDVNGIDPSFLFEPDGKAWIVHNSAPDKQLWNGHTCIRLHAFDWKRGVTLPVTDDNTRRSGDLRPQSRHGLIIADGGVNPAEKPVWIEGPHLYKIKGRYYLMCAEGGTSTQHSEVMFSSDKAEGPYKPCAVNPILTQRDIKDAEITCTGHADIVQHADGTWSAVFLACRPYDGRNTVMGRETMMLPAKWQGDQIVILPKGERLVTGGAGLRTCDDNAGTRRSGDLRPQSSRPCATSNACRQPQWSDTALATDAFFIRTGQPAYEIKDSTLTLTASSATATAYARPSAVMQWIKSADHAIETTVAFTPQTQQDLAGLLIFNTDECNITLGKSLDATGQPCVRLRAVSRGKLVTETTAALQDNKPVTLRAVCRGGQYTFYYNDTQIGSTVPFALVSSETAGSFTGTCAGVYATAKY